MKVRCLCGTVDLSVIGDITRENFVRHFVKGNEKCFFCGNKVSVIEDEQ